MTTLTGLATARGFASGPVFVFRGDGEIPVACGQFAHVYVPGKSLRRPISVCDARGGELRLVYQVKGEGTKIMSQMKAEE